MEKILQVLFYPNPTLLQKSEKIVSFDKNLKKFSQDMLKTVEHYKGIGLAAPQVGVLKRIFVMRLEDETSKEIQSHICINPEIKDVQGENFEEACLSIPSVQEKVTRKAKLTLHYQDLEESKELKGKLIFVSTRKT